MKKVFTLFLLMCCSKAFCQADTTSNNAILSIFGKIEKGVKEYKLDTSAAPNDKITAKIIELRKLRGSFNINEVIDYKLEEERQKKEMPADQLNKLSAYFKDGNGKKWLDNATIWIYRNHFTYKELKQLVRFYKKDAGQKMATEFPVIMMQSLAAAESIKAVLIKQ